MKGLRKYLSPFAPDQSGAAAVLCEFHGLIIILDAGGCAGNICGFDEPRWFESRSAIFSAGLRDMDAILGRDDRLDGTKLYDDGEKKTWKELFKKFAVEKDVEPGRIGIIGATPLEFGGIYEEDFLKKYFAEKGFSKVVCYGMGDGLDAVREAAAAEKNIVVSPAGIAAAKYLQQKFGTPYELFCPPEIIPEWKEKKEQVAGLLNVEELSEKKILIVHQQVLANTLREEFISANINVASWFMMNKEQKKEQDILFKEEDDWITYIKENEYDIIIADPLLKKAVPFYKGEWYDLPHFAISGKKRQSV